MKPAWYFLHLPLSHGKITAGKTMKSSDKCKVNYYGKKNQIKVKLIRDSKPTRSSHGSDRQPACLLLKQEQDSSICSPKQGLASTELSRKESNGEALNLNENQNH